ncbi:hypothetical protein N9354_00545 [Alphaproteobacteria bacterium]|nr:hypothetical protein [Alphaproteobacteria bacterium]
MIKSRPFFDYDYILLKEAAQNNIKNKLKLQSILYELEFRKKNSQNIDLINFCNNHLKHISNYKKNFKQKLFLLGNYKKNKKDEYSMKILDFKNYGKDKDVIFFAKKILDRFSRINKYKFTFLRVPSSKSDKKFTSCNKLIQKIISLSLKNHIDGGLLLIRHTTISPQKIQSKEVKNNKNRQFDSIKLSKSGINDVNGKNIILIDDITTSGTSINCCAKILEDFGANSVSMLVLGKTVYD